MKVNLQPRVFPTLQDPSGGLEIEDPFLTEHIYIVNAYFSVSPKFLQLWEVAVDDVISSFRSSFSSEGRRGNYHGQVLKNRWEKGVSGTPRT